MTDIVTALRAVQKERAALVRDLARVDAQMKAQRSHRDSVAARLKQIDEALTPLAALGHGGVPAAPAPVTRAVPVTHVEQTDPADVSDQSSEPSDPPSHRRENGVVPVLRMPPRLAGKTAEQRLLEALAERGTAKVVDLALAAGTGTETARACLNKLTRQGRIERPDPATYRAITEARSGAAQ